jgi:hypothetical protein
MAGLLIDSIGFERALAPLPSEIVDKPAQELPKANPVVHPFSKPGRMELCYN